MSLVCVHYNIVSASTWVAIIQPVLPHIMYMSTRPTYSPRIFTARSVYGNKSKSNLLFSVDLHTTTQRIHIHRPVEDVDTDTAVDDTDVDDDEDDVAEKDEDEAVEVGDADDAGRQRLRLVHFITANQSSIFG